MRRIIKFISFAAIAAAFSFGTVNAQGFSKKFNADVKFAFNIGDTVLPAGKYVLRVSGDANGATLLEIRNSDNDIVYTGYVATNGERSNDSSELRFENSFRGPVLAQLVSGNGGYTVAGSSSTRLIAAKKADKKEKKDTVNN
jgi:hypothetical protein